MIISFMQRAGSLVLRAFRVYKYNKENKTKIYSLNSSLSATYGKYVRVGRGCIVDKNVSIGDYSYVNINSSIENCIIGKYCSISSGVYINPYEHNLKMLTTHPIVREYSSKQEELRKKVIIGNDVLISLNVVITSGVRIGNGAVIGAGAVVTKDVRDYEIVGGVPAKHIGWRFDAEKRDELLSLAWWDWSEEKIRKNILWLRGEQDTILS